MKHDDFSDLSTLWQSETPPLKLDIAATQRRYRRQRWLMRFNLGAEVIALLVASGLSLWALQSDLPILTTAWIGLLTLWGWALFFPMNASRLRSFKLMQSDSLTASMADHIRLTEQEILRWKLSLISTLVLALLMGALLGARLLLNSYAGSDDLTVDIGIVIALLALAVVFYQRKQRSQRLLKTLQE